MLPDIAPENHTLSSNTPMLAILTGVNKPDAAEISIAKLTSPVVVLIGIVAWVAYSYLNERHAPPGPWRLPFLGNVLQVPKKMQFLRFTEWSQEYGPIFSLRLLGQNVVVLNSHQAAAELFDRRSSIYSSRPRFIMAGEILASNMALSFLEYGDQWRKLRRAANDGFSIRPVESYQPLQTKATFRMVLDMISRPEDWVENIKLSTSSAILSFVYGWPILEPGSPLAERLLTHAACLTNACLPGAFLVELIPFLKYLPAWIAPWKRKGQEWHKRETAMFEGFIADIAAEMSLGETQQSFVTGLIDVDGRHGLSTKESAWLASIMVVSGAEASASTLLNFVFAMVHNPAVLRKAQAEIDAVVGRERPPSFKDLDKLPYIQAMVKETLRWRPVGPLGVPHAVTEDDWYDGYFIPKGTIVIGNIWAMNRDPTIYPDPDAYRPERFLDETGPTELLRFDTHGMGHVSYGYGRRICVGMHFANQALLINIATMLWAFDIKPPTEENGTPALASNIQWEDHGVAVRPAPFDCRFSPRFAGVEDILSAAYSQF